MINSLLKPNKPECLHPSSFTSHPPQLWVSEIRGICLLERKINYNLIYKVKYFVDGGINSALRTYANINYFNKRREIACLATNCRTYSFKTFETLSHAGKIKSDVDCLFKVQMCERPIVMHHKERGRTHQQAGPAGSHMAQRENEENH